MPSASYLIIAFASAAGVAFAAWRLRALSLSGAVAALFVGFALFGFAGGYGAVSLLLFFVSSSLLSKIGKKRKDALQFEKGGQRDAMQVLANGGFAAACACKLPFADDENALMIAALLGAIAAANADTWATEIGTLFRHPPRRITDLKPAETGDSGAVSLPGTLAAGAGAALIGVMAWFWGFGFMGFLAVTFGGWAGAMADSLLGATMQVQYRDAITGKLTERTHTEDAENEWVRGVRWANNDVVNLLCTMVGAGVAVGFALVLR